MRIVFFPYEDKAIYYRVAAQIKKKGAGIFWGAMLASLCKGSFANQSLFKPCQLTMNICGQLVCIHRASF
jgi:hypothetical protein